MINYNLAQTLSKEALREAERNRIAKIAAQAHRNPLRRQLIKLTSRFSRVHTR